MLSYTMYKECRLFGMTPAQAAAVCRGERVTISYWRPGRAAARAMRTVRNAKERPPPGLGWERGWWRAVYAYERESERIYRMNLS